MAQSKIWTPRTLIALCFFFAASSGAYGDPLHFAPQRQWLNLPSPNPIGGQVAVGDVNGDGKADLVIYDVNTGQSWVALSTGTSFKAPVRWAFGLPRSTATLQFLVADVNGDHKADFIAFVHGNGQAAGSANVYVALSTGSSFQYTSQQVWNSGFCITEQVCKIADVNGDGKADLIAFTPKTGLVWTSLSTGTAFGPNAIWDRFFCISGEVCEMGDVSASGKFGLLLFKPHAAGNQKGNVLISPSSGSAFGASRYGHGYFCIDSETCLVGDLNGDHRTDILLVKGHGGSTLEVLAALSNGQSFINAVPFSWGNPVNADRSNLFGSFFVGDFNGDGRADMLQTDVLHAPTPGGGQRSVQNIYWVHLATTNPNPKPTQTNPTQAPTTGVKQVDIYNCDTSQDRLYYWTRDVTANTQSSQGPIDAMYSAAGTCPDPEDSPTSITLQSNHLYEIIAVDPNATACGGNNPDILSCRRDDAFFLGNPQGQVFRWIVPSR